VLIGLVAGILVDFSVEWFEVYFKVDDPEGRFPYTPSARPMGPAGAGHIRPFPSSALNAARGLAARREH